MKGLRFFLDVDGVQNRLTVVRFTGGEGVSQLFSFSIQAFSREPDIPPDSFVGRDAVLRVLSCNRAQEHLYHGMVTSFGLLHASHNGALYELELSSHLRPLAFTEDSRIFLSPGQSMDEPGTPIRDVLREAVTSAGLPERFFDVSGIRSAFSRRYVCQYRESHMHFCERWLEYLGAAYYFDHSSGTDKLIALDDGNWPRLSPDERPFREQSGLPSHEHEIIYSFVEHLRQVPGKVMIKDYNPDKPTLLLRAESPVSPQGRGVVYIYDDDPRTPDEAAFIASRRAEALAAQEQTFYGSGTLTGMRPGHVFLLNGHPKAALNQAYLITSVRHKASQTAFLAGDIPAEYADAQREEAYLCDFSCVRADRVYRPERKTSWPEVIGTLNAKIDAAGSGEYAELDEHGRYKVVMPFDESGRNAGQASCFLRMAQPYAGDRNGMHFPLTKGTEVLIGFADGDPDRPYIHAAIPNPETRSPVTEDNQTQLVIRSLNQTLVRIDDKKGLGHIHFHCPVQATTFQIGRNSMEGGLKNPFLGKGGALERGIMLATQADMAQEVSAGMFEAAGQDRIMRVHSGNYENSVTAGPRSESVAGNYTLDVQGNRESVVGGVFSSAIGQNRKLKVGGNETILAADSYFETCKTYKKQTVRGVFSITAPTGIEMTAPKITIQAAGNAVCSSNASTSVKAGDSLDETCLFKMKNAVSFEAEALSKTDDYTVNLLAQVFKLSLSSAAKTETSGLALSMKGASASSKLAHIEANALKVELLGQKAGYNFMNLELTATDTKTNSAALEQFLMKLDL